MSTIKEDLKKIEKFGTSLFFVILLWMLHIYNCVRAFLLLKYDIKKSFTFIPLPENTVC